MKEPSSDVSNSEKSLLLQMIADHPDLQQYLHPELAGNVPVKLKSNEQLGTDLSLKKFGLPVQVVASADVGAVLEVTVFLIEGGRLQFELAYEVQGVTIRGTLVKREEQWAFEDMEVLES